MSQATDELRDTLSQISKHSKQTTTLRVSDWVNEGKKPDNVSNQLQTNTVDLSNVAGSSTPTVITDSTNVVQTRQAMLPMRSSANLNIGLGQNHSLIRNFVCSYQSEANQYATHEHYNEYCFLRDGTSDYVPASSTLCHSYYDNDSSQHSNEPCHTELVYLDISDSE